MRHTLHLFCCLLVEKQLRQNNCSLNIKINTFLSLQGTYLDFATVNSEIFATVLFSGNDEITLPFTDVGISCYRCDFFLLCKYVL